MGEEQPATQAALFELPPAMTEEENEHRCKFYRMLDSMIALCWAGWDERQQEVARKVQSQVLVADLEKVHNLRKFLDQIERAISGELDSRQATAAMGQEVH